MIIPARYASSRLPGKPLLDIHGKSLLQHVYESACRSQAEAVHIATDDPRIRQAAQAFSAQVVMTKTAHPSGTDRLAEVVSILQLQDEEIIVNLQGDEIATPAQLIYQVAAILYEHADHSIATLCEKIEQPADVDDPNVVKVVFDRNNSALYFSRSVVPYAIAGRQHTYFRHIGLYAYRVAYLKKFIAMPPAELELAESLEQLRALAAGEKIYVAEACAPTGIGIDTEEDLLAVRQHYHKELSV